MNPSIPGHSGDRRLARLVGELVGVGVRVQGVSIAASARLGHGDPHLGNLVHLKSGILESFSLAVLSG